MVGFKFCDRHCGEFWIHMRSKSRPLLPERRRRQLEIPQLHGRYDFGGSTYDMRVITLECFVYASDIPAFRSRLRDIAEWLSQKGPLVFDDEPDKTYDARIFSSVPVEQMMSAGIFTLVFDCQPFANGQERILSFTASSSPAALAISNRGTQESPCVITLTNAGGGNIEGVSLAAGRSAGGLDEFQYTKTLAAGSTLEIDTERYMVRLNDSLITAGYSGEFFRVLPGASVIRYSDTGSARQISLSVKWTELYL